VDGDEDVNEDANEDDDEDDDDKVDEDKSYPPPPATNRMMNPWQRQRSL
jgi:hypothetical protein